MKVPTLLYIFLVILFEVHAKTLDTEPNAVKKSTAESALVSTSSTSETSEVSKTKKKRYATKEVIVYLTPSQIEALKAGEGLISLQSLPESGDHEQQINQDLKLKEQTEFVKQEFENLKSASIQEVEHPDEENLELASQEPILQKELLSSENQQALEDQWRQELANQEQQLKLRHYYHELNKAEQLKLQHEVNGDRNAWLSYYPNIQISEGYRVEEPQQENHIPDISKIQLKALSPLPLHDQHSENYISQNVRPLLQLLYSPKYNDQKKAIAIAKILKAHHNNELEKQSALSQVEKIADPSARLVNDHFKIMKQHATPVVKHVEVPVATPVWVPVGSVPNPVPVRVLRPYPALQEIIKHIPVPIEQRVREEVKRPVPQVESRISEPFTKIVFFNVGTPHDQKIVPIAIKSWS